MWYRRALFNVQFAATIVLPLWMLIGRVFFGVILGWHYAIQLFLAPLLFVFLAVIATLSWARRRSRASGAVSSVDAALISVLYLSVIVYGFFVVDSVHSTEPGKSVATELFGQGLRDASFTIADIAGGFMIVAGLATFWVVLVEYLFETRPELVTSLTGLDLTDADPVHAELADAQLVGAELAEAELTNEGVPEPPAIEAIA
jgi:hypothetical protein